MRFIESRPVHITCGPIASLEYPYGVYNVGYLTRVARRLELARDTCLVLVLRYN